MSKNFLEISEKITDDELAVTKLVFLGSDDYQDQFSIFAKKYGTFRDKMFIPINAVYRKLHGDNRALLMDRSITWGQYNKTREELDIRYYKEINSVPQ